MALTYHAGRRIQGLAYTASNITKDEDFSDVWNGVGTNGSITVTNQELFIDTVLGNSDTRVYKALGFTLATDWTARWEQTMKGTTDNNVYMQVMNFTAGNNNLAVGTNQDRVHMITDSNTQTIYVRSQNGGTTGNQSSGQALTTDTKYYMEFVKNGTGLTLKIRTGSHSGTLVNTLTTTCSSDVTGLTHIQTGGATGTNSGSASYIIDNIEVWNNSTSATGTATYSENFSSATVWTQSPTDSQFAVSSSDGRLNFLDDVNSTGDRTWYDLGTDVSTTQWVLRFKFRFTTLSNGSIQYYEFDAGLSDTTVDNNTNQNFIGVRVLPNDDIDLWRPRVCDGSSSPRSGATADLTQVFATNTDYFAEIKRTSASNWAISLSTTNAYDGDLQNNSYTDASGATGLRYLKIGDAVTNTGTGFSMEGYVDDVEFYNDTTTAVKTAIGDAKPTNVQVGSRFEETDTRKMFNYNEPDFNKTDCVGYYTLDETSGNPTNHVTTANGFTDIPTSTIYYLAHGHDSTGRHFVKKVGSTVTTITESDYINLKGAITESHKGTQTSDLPSAWSGMWQGSTSSINGHDWFAISFSTDPNSTTNGSSGATQNVTGKFGKCFEFSGGNNEQVNLNGSMMADYYNPSYHASTSHKADFTLSCWINLSSDNTGYPSVISNYGGSNTGGFQFLLWGANKISLHTSTSVIHGSTVMSSGTWYHVVGIRESGYLKLYVNGSEDATAVANAHHIEAKLDMAIGGKADGTSGVNAKIDEVSIWRRALSASEISELYNSGTGKTLLEAKQAKEWQEIGA